MRFVKASEREPADDKTKHIKTGLGEITSGWYDKEDDVWRYHADDGNIIEGGSLDNLLWLDETLPTSIEQEVEKMYPDADVQKIKKEFPEERDHVRIINTINYEAGIRRSAHITAARMYMGEMERLRKALEKSLEWIADIKQKDIPLDDKKGMALYHIKWLATEALKNTTQC